MKAPQRLLGVPPNIFYLGLASFLGDISSEMTLTIPPLFLPASSGWGRLSSASLRA